MMKIYFGESPFSFSVYLCGENAFFSTICFAIISSFCILLTCSLLASLFSKVFSYSSDVPLFFVQCGRQSIYDFVSDGVHQTKRHIHLSFFIKFTNFFFHFVAVNILP